MVVSDLQLALIGLGATAVASVWAYNKWQERGHRKLAERILHGGEKQDVLLGAASGDASADRVEPGQRMEPGMAAAAGVAAADTAASSPWADGLADALAHLDFAEAIAAPSLWAAQAEWAGHLGKTLHWLGQSGGQSDADWRLLSAHDAGRYTKVICALQLADRRGAVTEGELETFIDGIGAVATQLAGVAVMPQLEASLAQARALDEFCASVDFQLAVHVATLAGAAFSGTKLRGLAEAAGMQLDDDGRFHLKDDTGDTLYTLGNVGVELFDGDTLRSLSTHAVTLSLDVPNVAQGPQVFDHMVSAARQLAQALGGALVNAQHVPLTDDMIAGIRARIEEIQARMAAQQIAAGSARARRLFA